MVINTEKLSCRLLTAINHAQSSLKGKSDTKLYLLLQAYILLEHIFVRPIYHIILLLFTCSFSHLRCKH
uniref:Uncharacterized protein n=1 Tax=Triticum urartu TaxID=4572 RepID=A0A8R7VBT4_TRIUA